MNLIILTGRTTRDPELKFGQSGKAFCKFTLAVNRVYKKDEVDFINCTAFNKITVTISNTAYLLGWPLAAIKTYPRLIINNDKIRLVIPTSL